MRRFSDLFLAVFVCLAIASCARQEFVFRSGDLVFCVAGTEGMSSAVAASTAWGDSVKFDHVAIVAVNEGIPYIIEATSSAGVRCIPWEEFLETSSGGGRRGAVVMRVNTEFPLDKAIDRAMECIGQEYDWHFLPDNGKLYCSELVWECYRWDDGSRLFSASPMNFRDSEGNMPEFWTALFEKFGEPVPEGVPGTNPNDMSKSPELTFVHRFF